MLKLLMGLSPQIIMLVCGLGGGAVALAGAKVWNDVIDNPGIRREETAICLARVERTAADAKLAEAQRQYAAGRAAAETLLKTQLEAEVTRQAQIKGLENDIAAYERRARAEGRSCPLDAGGLDFLNGVPEHKSTP